MGALFRITLSLITFMPVLASAQMEARLPETFGPFTVEGNPNCSTAFKKGIFISGVTCYKRTPDGRCEKTNSNGTGKGGRILYLDLLTNQTTEILRDTRGNAAVIRGLTFDKDGCILYYSHGHRRNAIGRLPLNNNISYPITNRHAYGTYGTRTNQDGDMAVGDEVRNPIEKDPLSNKMYVANRVDGTRVDMIRLAPVSAMPGTSNAVSRLVKEMTRIPRALRSINIYNPDHPVEGEKPQLYIMNGVWQTPGLAGVIRITKLKNRHGAYNDGFGTRTFIHEREMPMRTPYSMTIDQESKKLYVAQTGVRGCAYSGSCSSTDLGHIVVMDIAPDEMNANATDRNQMKPDHCSRNVRPLCDKSMFNSPYRTQIANGFMNSKQYIYLSLIHI